MKRDHVLNRTGFVALACLACLAISPVLRAAASKPNVIIFLVDDMGWMDSTVYGSKYYDTPNMERLAKMGMRFTEAYATPLCSPTRASIQSGQYSARHGILSATGHQAPQPPGHIFIAEKAAPNRPIIIPESKNYLEPSQFTIAEALKAAGYRTGHFGKWHLGRDPQHWPETQGYDVAWHCHPDPGPPSYFSPYGVTATPSGSASMKSRVGNITDGPPGEYITDRLTDEAVRFIKDNKDRPFFLNLCQYGVHGPWGHKESLTRIYAQRTDPRGLQGNPIMASMLKSVDESLGRVLDTLEELKLAENTLFIFFSDNGGNTHSNTAEDPKMSRRAAKDDAQVKDWRKWAGVRPPTNNTPLRDGKGTIYEGGTRVPLMVVWPGQVPAATTSGAVVGAVDLYPTILDALHVAPNPSQRLDGVSFVPVLKDPAAKLPRSAYFTYFPSGGPTKPGGVWVRSGDFKLIRLYETGPNHPDLHELYNLREDIGETKNLAAQMPEKVKELDALIDAFLKDTNALTPKPNPAYRGATTRPTSPNRPLGGWVPKSSKAVVKNGALLVEADGRNPFLGIASLKLAGPITLHLRVRSAGGAAKVQWRTADQETFPGTGQMVEFSIPASKDWHDATVQIPAKGSMVHMRLYVPAQPAPIEIDRIELTPSKGEARVWDFN